MFFFLVTSFLIKRHVSSTAEGIYFLLDIIIFHGIFQLFKLFFELNSFIIKAISLKFSAVQIKMLSYFSAGFKIYCLTFLRGIIISDYF